MRILVTGATGYVGTNLCKKLAEQGHQVHAFCRSKAKAADLNHKNIEVHLGDILDEESLDKAMTSCTHVFHTAAYVSVWAKDPQTYWRINVDGTENVLKTAQKHKVERVVVTSTAGVFGPSESMEEVDEAKNRTIPFFNEYEISKADAHKKVMEYVDKGVDALIVCPTRIFGPGLISESNSVTKMIDLYLRGKWHLLPGDGTKSGNYVFVEDVVNGHLLALTEGKKGEKYILGGENISYNDLFLLFDEISGKKFRLNRVPLWIMMSFAGFQQFMATAFGKKPLITPKWVRRYLHDWSNSSAKAERDLGYKITSLRDAIAKTIDWIDEGNHFS